MIDYLIRTGLATGIRPAPLGGIMSNQESHCYNYRINCYGKVVGHRVNEDIDNYYKYLDEIFFFKLKPFIFAL